MRHLFAVDAKLCQSVARSFRHQSDILDTHDDGVHVLVCEDATLRVMYDGNQLRCTDTGIVESWSILLDHLEQLRTIALNHSTQSVAYQLSGFVTLQTELSHQCVSSIDSLAEVHVVCVNHCTGGIGHGVGSRTFQSCGNSGYLVLFSQFRIIASPCFRCLIDDGNTGTDGTCHHGGLRGKHSHEVATQSNL